MVLDRMVNLLCSGCVVPVVKYIKQCWQRGDTDISLIRYFVTEVNQSQLVGFRWKCFETTPSLLGPGNDWASVQPRFCSLVHADGGE